MRILISLVSFGVLALSYTPASALGCKDIPGAKVDPDLQVMATSFGRLLPGRELINEKKLQNEAIAIRRVVATRIQTTDGSARADLMMSNDNTTILSALINGQTFNQTTQSKVTNLGYQDNVEKIALGLAKIGQSGEAFVSPQIGPPLNLDDLSTSNPEITTEQHNLKIAGTPTTQEQTNIRYTCTNDAEFAGNPADLPTMVVLRGVVKAVTIVKTITTDRSLDINISDVAIFKTVSKAEFQDILANFSGIAKMMQVAQVTDPDPVPPSPAASGQTMAQIIEPAVDKATVDIAAENPAQPTSSNAFVTELVAFFSLTKPGTWVLLLLAMLLSGVVFRRSRSNRALSAKKTAVPVEPAAPLLPEPEETSEKIDKESDERPAGLVRVVESSEQIASLRDSVETATTQAREQRQANIQLKLRLDGAENQVRDLTTQVIELQTSSALLESRLTADQRSVLELASSNQQLLGINQGYRESISEIEAEQTALMDKLSLREDALSHAEKLNNEMHNFNEEISHVHNQEKTTRAALEAELDRLDLDYNTLWTSSSERVAQFREETAAQKIQIREMRDDLISLETELNVVRKDRDSLSRDSIIMGNENSRISNEHKAATSMLENKIRQLHLDLAAYRRALAENQIAIPNTSLLPTSSRYQRDLKSYEDGHWQVREEKTEPEDNVVPLTQQKTGWRK
ncbi:hypothetical protein MNBD_ALPHA08-19 [hydrothermal vent metagenome]|uniref:Uncharacterized protein n=1 Tax=hydrothermal vent metagenome TaxID=652676 RepID=A0A3B0S098_9ZZZZ